MQHFVIQRKEYGKFIKFQFFFLHLLHFTNVIAWQGQSTRKSVRRERFGLVEQ